MGMNTKMCDAVIRETCGSPRIGGRYMVVFRNETDISCASDGRDCVCVCVCACVRVCVCVCVCV
jgi:hypothetical protein